MLDLRIVAVGVLMIVFGLMISPVLDAADGLREHYLNALALSTDPGAQ